MRWGWHPILFSAYPIVFLYSRNSDDLPLDILWRPLMVALVFGLLVWVAARRMAGDGGRGALLATGALVLWSAYGHAHEVMAGSAIGQHRLLLPVWILLLILLVRWARRASPTPHALTTPNATLVMIGVGLLTVSALTAVPPVRPSDYETLGMVIEIEAIPGVTPGRIYEDADIYHIILDGYGRADILADLYDHDNAPFLDELRKRGFCVVDSARANHVQTLFSLIKTMNACSSVKHPTDGGSGRRELAAAMKRAVHLNPLAGECDWTRAFATGYSATEVMSVDAYSAPWLALNEFERALVASTPLGIVLNLIESRFGDVSHRRIVEHAFTELPVPSDAPPRAYTFAHIIAPHPPFVFAPAYATAGALVPLADGDHVVNADLLSVEQYRAGYRAQIEAVNDRLLETLDEILGNGRDSIILLHGDHGPGSLLEWERIPPSPAAARERLGILMAVRMVRGNDNLCDRAGTPRGLVRELICRLNNAVPAAYEERSYYSTWSRPFDFVEIGPDGEVITP
jgi:hypothetical protein